MWFALKDEQEGEMSATKTYQPVACMAGPSLGLQKVLGTDFLPLLVMAGDD